MDLPFDIAGQYRKGTSKQGLIQSVYYQGKQDNKKFTKYEAQKMVEEAILRDYLKNIKGEKK